MRVLLIVCLACLAAAAGCSTAPARPPDIIVLLVDTLRADYLGYNGFDGPVSPNLDALAKESLVYDRCFAQSPWTKPSVASLFTSLYPQVHRLTNHEGRYWSADSPGLQTGILSDQAVTLAERLRESGYRTAGFVSNPWVGGSYGFAQGFDVYDETVTADWHRSDLLLAAARRWMESTPTDRPAFVYLHFMDVHAPYDAPREDYDAIVESKSLGENSTLGGGALPFRAYHNIEIRPSWASDELRTQVRYWRARYASGVRALDRRLGDFLQYLKESGRLERSILVFTSDHGEELYDHRGWSHGQNLYDEQLHVPLMIRMPDARGGGTRIQQIVQLIDVMPTLLSLAGAEIPPRAEGRDLNGLDAAGAEGVAFATATQRTPDYHSLRTSRYKLHYNARNGGMWLFDVADDPNEQREISGGNPEITTELRDRLIALMDESLANGTLDMETTEIPEQVRERLKALGYLD